MAAPVPGWGKIVAATLATLVLTAAALALLGATLWTEDALRKRLLLRALSGVLALMIIGAAAYRHFVIAPRSRRPRWQLAYVILLLLWAAYLFVLAFRGGE